MLMGNKTKKQLREPQCISPVLAGASTDGVGGLAQPNVFLMALQRLESKV